MNRGRPPPGRAVRRGADDPARNAAVRIEVALVADDLTGALDAAAPFATCGLRVRVYRTLDALPAAPVSRHPAEGANEPASAAFDDAGLRPPTAGLPAADAVPRAAGAASPVTQAAHPGVAMRLRPAVAESPPAREGGSAPPGGRGVVLAVNTSTRHLTPGAARAAVAEAGRRLRGWSPRVVFKKIDSTLRGPVPDEVAAAMQVFERRTALVCPAFPAAGRVVRGGEVHVYGAPLRETEYVRDLRTPAPAESLEALFRRIGPVEGVRPDDLPRNHPPAGIAIADAETDAHLAGLAALVADHPSEILAVGSDGLAAGLASLLGGEKRGVELAGEGGGAVLFAVGSRAGTTARQVERLLERRPDAPVVDAPRGELDAPAVLHAAASSRAVVARVPSSPAGDPAAVARAFGAAVREVLDGLGPGRPVVLAATGGDTVEAILDALGIAVLDVLGEFRPGVPVSRAGADRPGFTLVSKAGGFGSLDLFAELAAEAAGR